MLVGSLNKYDSSSFIVCAQGLKARGNVEDWLGKVEEAMFSNLRKLLKASIADYERNPREEWIMGHAHQVSDE